MTPARVIPLRTAASVACLVLAMVLGLAGCGSHSRYMSHMDRGRQYLAAGNLEKARIEFRNALQIEPKDAEAFYV
jgi:Tfp pilus assembly protein PilF